MSLKNFKRREEVIETPGGNLAVRGLSLTDIAEIVVVHKESVGPIFDSFVATGRFDLADVSAAGMALIQQFPIVAAHIIACATGDPTEIDAARDLPAGLQIDVLERAAALTIESQGGAKKLVGVVVQLIANSRKQIPTP